MTDPYVIFFLNSGRCGTQWLASGLREIYPGLSVEHEPIGRSYRPRLYFRRYADAHAILEVPEVRSHIAAITNSRSPYVETGWPCFAALPLLAERMPEQLRVVHLTRHPVPSALSHVSHNSYAGGLRRDNRLAILRPTDDRVFQPQYAARWKQLSAYERCLFWWTEVQLFGFEFAEHFRDIPFIRISFEDLIRDDRESLSRLLEFMGLQWSDHWVEHAKQRVDRWHHQTDESFDVYEVLNHPTTIDVARRLGYGFDHLDVDRFDCRYRGAPPGGRRNALVGARKRIARIVSQPFAHRVADQGEETRAAPTDDPGATTSSRNTAY